MQIVISYRLHAFTTSTKTNSIQPETEEAGSYCCQATKLQGVRAQKNITWM